MAAWFKPITNKDVMNVLGTTTILVASRSCPGFEAKLLFYPGSNLYEVVENGKPVLSLAHMDTAIKKFNELIASNEDR